MMPEKSEITNSDSARTRRMLKRHLDEIFDAFRRSGEIYKIYSKDHGGHILGNGNYHP